MLIMLQACSFRPKRESFSFSFSFLQQTFEHQLGTGHRPDSRDTERAWWEGPCKGVFAIWGVSEVISKCNRRASGDGMVMLAFTL